MWDMTLSLLMLMALLASVVAYLWRTPGKRPQPQAVRVKSAPQHRNNLREE